MSILEALLLQYYSMKRIVHLNRLILSWSLINHQKYLPQIPFHFNLHMRPLCHTLSNALDMSKNTPQTSRPSSNNLCISWLIDRSWLMHESPGLNPDWLLDIKSIFCEKFKHIIIQYSFKYFSGNRKQGCGTTIFQYFLVSFFMCWNYICFLPFKRKFSTFKTWFKY